MSPENAERLQMLELSIKDLSVRLEVQTVALNHLVDTVERITTRYLDVATGIQQQETMRIDDHRQIMRTTLWTFTVLICVALGITKVGDIGRAIKVAQNIELGQPATR